MPLIEKHPLGHPCWFELATPNLDAAKTFYHQLLGWSSSDSPMGPDEVYVMFHQNNLSMGGAYRITEPMEARGIRPHWMIFFATPDLESSCRNIVALDGTITVEPMQIGEHGRMAVATDPEGAVFSLWEPAANPGVAAYGDPFTVCWSELATRDANAASNFYRAVFAWDTRPSPNSPSTLYLEFSAAGLPVGGILQMTHAWGDIPPHWSVYFLVPNVDASVQLLQQLGGFLRHGPFEAPGVGRIAVVADPQGVHFYLITLNS
jgi:predicted enzyme related to lactoylglutathione lyase